jgi:hypothetical protein
MRRNWMKSKENTTKSIKAKTAVKYFSRECLSVVVVVVVVFIVGKINAISDTTFNRNIFYVKNRTL